jgi:4-amino-4-deoxy-L-arabinose transferase-like glycosyltransferase
VQALFGATSSVLTAWIGARHFGARAGLVAGYIVAFYGMLIYFDGELLAASLTIVLQLAAVAIAFVPLMRRSRSACGSPPVCSPASRPW